MDAVVLGRGEGEAHSIGSSLVTIKATGDETAETLFLGESEIAPGFPVHRPITTSNSTTCSTSWKEA
ncbi:MAG: hypothetical protein ACR2L0_04900 [Gaiellaceae bacterium]